MLQLSRWPYIQTMKVSGNIEADIKTLLSLNGKQETASHSISVARISEKIAGLYGLDQSVAAVSALLHDISNIMKPQDMLTYAIYQGWELDESERIHPFILHQRLSMVFAEELFGITDKVILSAIECHTTLRWNPSDYDMILFLADKLSWGHQETNPFYETVRSALEKSLSYASLSYINFVLKHGMVLHPHRWLLEAKSWLEKLA